MIGILILRPGGLFATSEIGALLSRRGVKAAPPLPGSPQAEKEAP